MSLSDRTRHTSVSSSPTHTTSRAGERGRGRRKPPRQHTNTDRTQKHTPTAHTRYRDRVDASTGYIALPSRASSFDPSKPSTYLSKHQQETIYATTMRKLVDARVYVMATEAKQPVSHDTSFDDATYHLSQHMEEASERIVKDLVLTFRQLRETVTATRRMDAFVVQLYERSVETALLVNDLPELIKASTRLSNEIYPALLPTCTPRRAIFAVYRALLLVCLLEDQSAWLTWLATDPQSSAVDACSAQAEHYRQMLQHTWRITRAYRQYDWIEFAAAWDALLQEAALFPKEGACLPLRHLYQTILPRMRQKTLQILRVSYLQLPLDTLARWLQFNTPASNDNDATSSDDTSSRRSIDAPACVAYVQQQHGLRIDLERRLVLLR